MSVSIPDFWKLVVESQLLSDDQCRQLDASFGQVKGAAPQQGAKPLVEWLVSQNALSRYQTEVLLGGRAGPFCYDDYKIYDRIGSGRLAGMYRAAHAPSGHPVLLEFLSGVAAQDKQVWTTVVQRTIALANVTHGNLVKYYEPVDLTTYKLLVLEDLRGQSADVRLAHGGPLKIGEACAILRLALQGLAQLHQLGAAHGDIRPANLWIGASGNIKLLYDPFFSSIPIDFSKPDATGAAAARADYLAPEMAQPGRQPDALGDIYALGCTLYHMLAGKPPFSGGDVAQKLARHAGEAIQPLEQFGVPHAAAQIVAYMMAKNASVRYQTLAQVDQQLAALADASRMDVQPAPAAATLPAYENWVRQKQAALGMTAPARPSARMTEPIPALGSFSFAAETPRISLAAASGAEGPRAASAASKYRSARPRKKNTALFAIIGATTAAAAIVAIVLLASGGNQGSSGPSSQPAAANSSRAVSSNGSGADSDAASVDNEPGDDNSAVAATVDAAPPQQVVEDDGRLLWASPTAGESIALNYAPPGGQIFVVIRPADLLAAPDGDKLLRALGPEFEAARLRWEQASGVPLAEIDQLIVSLYANDGRMPRAVFVVRPVAALSEDDLLARWRNPAAAEGEQGKTFTGDGWSYWIPAENGGGLFVMGDAADLEAAAALSGAPPVLRREVELLRKSSDADRHLTILLAPKFLFSDGRELFAGDREKLLEPLDWLLGDGIQAGLASLHFGDAFYVEVRMIGEAALNEIDLAEALKDRLQQIPDKIEQYIVRLNPSDYWRAVAFRYPSMVRAFHQQTRVGAEEEQAIINTVLPGAAAHNLIFGAEMALASTPGEPAASAGPPRPAAPQTIEEALQTRLTLSFDQTSLEFAMSELAGSVKDKLGDAPVDFRIVIIGEDLQKDGITRNQQIRDFSEQDKTAAEILTAMVMRANPVTTVQQPSEADQKLVWVVGPDPNDSAKRIVLITTRQACEAKGYQLPAPFQPK